jgi:mitochondrial fission 1 protein
LVHSKDKRDVHRGLELVAALVSSESAELRELQYLRAVGEVRLRHYLAARQTLKDLLATTQSDRQAEALLEKLEDELVKDGLLGLGAGALVVGVVAAIAAMAAKKR